MSDECFSVCQQPQSLPVRLRRSQRLCSYSRSPLQIISEESSAGARETFEHYEAVFLEPSSEVSIQTFTLHENRLQFERQESQFLELLNNHFIYRNPSQIGHTLALEERATLSRHFPRNVSIRYAVQKGREALMRRKLGSSNGDEDDGFSM